MRLPPRVWLRILLFRCGTAHYSRRSPHTSAGTPQGHAGTHHTARYGFGFLERRRDNDEVAAQYLNTRLRGKPASNLAHQLFVVLDRRLPAKLDELSDKPEDPLQPNMDRVGNINSSNGNVDILLERVDLGKAGYRWLFSGQRN